MCSLKSAVGAVFHDEEIPDGLSSLSQIPDSIAMVTAKGMNKNDFVLLCTFVMLERGFCKHAIVARSRMGVVAWLLRYCMYTMGACGLL